MDRARKTPQVISIQSAVSYGHVGNSAALFPLQRLGVEVWPVNTVQFSNHTGYDAWRGTRATAEEIRDLIAGLEHRGVLDNADAILSGYLGSAEIVEVVATTVARAKEKSDDRIHYCCDPVMGAAGRGFFVAPEIPALIRDLLVPMSDLITPNQFELEFLTGTRITTTPELLDAADQLRSDGKGIVLVTSVHTDETPVDSVDVIATSAWGTWRVRTPVLPVQVGGTGDVVTALFIGWLLHREKVSTALARSTSSIFALLEETWTIGSEELALIAGQRHLVEPPDSFRIERLR
jgi:pyridoxine kinase